MRTQLLLLAAAALPAAFTQAATYYWDAGSVSVDGGSAGGAGTWAAGASGWEDGAAAQNWTDGNLAVFGGGASAVTLGGAVAASGLRFAGTTGAYALSASTRYVLTLGTSGVDMSTAGGDVSLNLLTVAVGANSQTWNVASGRTLYLSSTTTLNGQLSGAAGTTITVDGGGLVDLLPSTTGLSSYAGNWLVRSGSTLRTLRNGSAALGTGTVTLDGGTLTVGGVQGSGAQGNWAFGAAIKLGPSGVNYIDNQLPTGGTPATRYLKLESAIGESGGAAGLTFRNTRYSVGVMTNDEYGFILSGTSTFTGAMTIGANTFVRIGGSAAGSYDSNAGNYGSLDSDVAIANDGVLRLTRNDAWTLANAISGSGQLKIGGAVGTTTGQVVTVSGANTYTGATLVANGTLKLGGASALGSAAAGTTVSSGAVLDLNGRSIGAEALTINGTGISSGGALVNSSAIAASHSGSVVLGSAASLGGAGDIVLGGNITGAFALTKVGAGKLTLIGASNAATGVTVSAGTLVTGGVAALGVGGVTVLAGSLQIGDGVSNAVTLGASAALVVNDGAVLRFAATDSAIALNGGTAALGAATGCTLDLNNAFNAAGSYNLISGGTVSANACALANFDSTNYSAVFTDGTLVVTAVPESLPSGLSVAGALAAVLLRRRRRAKTAG